MNNRVLPCLMIIAASLAVVGCNKSHATVREVTVEETASLLEQGSGVAIDVNTDDFRAQNGKLPGAFLLANYRQYDAKKSLGGFADKTLIFYCTSRL